MAYKIGASVGIFREPWKGCDPVDYCGCVFMRHVRDDNNYVPCLEFRSKPRVPVACMVAMPSMYYVQLIHETQLFPCTVKVFYSMLAQRFVYFGSTACKYVSDEYCNKHVSRHYRISCGMDKYKIREGDKLEHIFGASSKA